MRSIIDFGSRNNIAFQTCALAPHLDQPFARPFATISIDLGTNLASPGHYPDRVLVPISEEFWSYFY